MTTRSYQWISFVCGVRSSDSCTYYLKTGNYRDANFKFIVTIGTRNCKNDNHSVLPVKTNLVSWRFSVFRVRETFVLVFITIYRRRINAFEMKAVYSRSNVVVKISRGCVYILLHYMKRNRLRSMSFTPLCVAQRPSHFVKFLDVEDNPVAYVPYSVMCFQYIILVRGNFLCRFACSNTSANIHRRPHYNANYEHGLIESTRNIWPLLVQLRYLTEESVCVF